MVENSTEFHFQIKNLTILKILFISKALYLFFQVSELLAFIVEMSYILTCFITPEEKASGPSQNACSVLAQSLIHDLVFSGESKKQCLFKKPESDPALDVDQVGENENSETQCGKMRT